MDDLPEILDDAIRSYAETLTKARSMVLKYSLAAGVFMLVWCLVLYLGPWHRPGFPMNVVLIFFPLFIFFIARNDLKKRYYCKHYEDAIRVLQTEPETADDFYQRAECLVTGPFDASESIRKAAEADYAKALELEPNNDEILYGYATYLWYVKKSDAALPVVEKLCKIDGDNQSEAFKIKGEILAKTDPKEAEACFDKAIELDPDDTEFHATRVRFYLDANRLDDAERGIAETNKILKRKMWPAPAELFEVQGTLAMKQGRAEDAVKQYTKAIKLYRLEPSYYQLRGDAYDAIGDVSRAADDRRRAEELNDKSND